MLTKFVELETKLDEAIVKVQEDRVRTEGVDTAKLRASLNKEPGEVLTATELALQDLKEVVVYFRKNFLDKDGKFIKLSVWKWVFEKQYRTKIKNAIEYFIEKIQTIASRFA